MPQFTYRARNAQGGLVEGVLDCADRAVAIRQIESQQCIPIRIDMVEAAKPAETKTAAATSAQKKLRLLGTPEVATPSRSLKIPHSQLLIFTEQLAHLLQDGMTLD
jgi:type II secretory pathway component PulF